jgi:hypothetical protein
MMCNSLQAAAVVTPFARWLCACGIVVGVSLFTSPVSASCGHYVKRMGPGFVPGKAAAQRVARELAAPNQTPCGCQGPECRRAPQDSVPLSPKAPSRQFTSQDLVIAAANDTPAEPRAGTLYGASVIDLSSGYPKRLNRPPAA